MFLLANCMQLEARDLIDISSIVWKSNDYALSIVGKLLLDQATYRAKACN